MRQRFFGRGKFLVTIPASAVKFQFYVFQVDPELSQAIVAGMTEPAHKKANKLVLLEADHK